jgi:hypothetical protein
MKRTVAVLCRLHTLQALQPGNESGSHFFYASAARSSSETLASMSSISIAFAAWLMMASAARTRVEGGAVCSNHHLAERGYGRSGHLLQSRNRLAEGGTAGFPERLLELWLLLPAHKRGD